MSDAPPIEHPAVATRAFAGAFAGYAGRRGWLAVALVGGGALVEGVGVLLLVPILGIVLAEDGGSRWPLLARWLTAAGATTPTARLAWLLAGFVGVMGVRAAILYARDLTLARLQIGFVEAIRNNAVEALARAPWQDVAGLRHARVTNLMSADIQRIAASVQFLVQGGVAFALLLIQTVLAIALAPLLASGVALLLVIAGGGAVALARGSRDLGGQLVQASLSLMQSATGFLGGLKAAVAENRQASFVAEFTRAQAQMRDHQLEFVRRQARSRTAFALSAAVAGATVVLAGIATGVTPSVLVTLILIFARMSGPAQTVQAALQNFLFGLPSFDAVRRLERELGGTGALVEPIEPPPGDIVLAAATLRHAGGGGVGALDLTIAEGSFIGLAGPSGAGKTSLVDLLSGLVAPHTGRVAVGGTALDVATRAGWRERVGYVPQDGFLFHDSVRRNLDPDGAVDDAALARALAITGGDLVVAGLEHGLDTVVGERGARLSGGERQRIAIARALLRGPRLLILDEATSAIDAPSEAQLLDALASLSPRPTIVLVAHRAESLARCDRVIRLAAGRVRD